MSIILFASGVWASAETSSTADDKLGVQITAALDTQVKVQLSVGA